jgi:four helix bundle protein
MPESNECWFDHEKLEVYREAIAFVAWLSGAMEATVRAGEVKDQLDRASTSIPLNIAEGNGKYAPKDRCRFFDIAHGSALECAAGLDILVAKAKLTADQIRPGKERLQRIVRMLMGLIKRFSTREYEKEDNTAE